MMVFTLGRSMPLSIIAVQTSTSYLPSSKSIITRSSSRSFICPCPTAMRASGTSRCKRDFTCSMPCTRLCTKNTCPPRPSSRKMACLMMASSYCVTYVRIGSRSSGGVSIVLISRAPISAMLSVRGMGVAVIVSTSIAVRNCLSFSFAFTPKRCSSSMMSRPSSLNCTSSCNRRWVPMTISTPPCDSCSKIFFCCDSVRKRESISTSTGNGLRRCVNVLRCCSASTVVGTNTATCLPSFTALKAARKATSVLP